MAPKATSLPTAVEIGQLVPIGRMAGRTPYSVEFLRQLARSGKIRAFKLNRDWLTTPEAILAYLKTQGRRHEQQLVAIKASERSLV